MYSRSDVSFGSMEINVARALRTVEKGFCLIEHLGRNFENHPDMYVLGNDKNGRGQARKEFSRLERLLNKAVLKDRQEELPFCRTQGS
jgi:hypothetical protein